MGGTPNARGRKSVGEPPGVTSCREAEQPETQMLDLHELHLEETGAGTPIASQLLHEFERGSATDKYMTVVKMRSRSKDFRSLSLNPSGATRNARNTPISFKSFHLTEVT